MASQSVRHLPQPNPDVGRQGPWGRRGKSLRQCEVGTLHETFKIETVYPMAYKSFEDVIADLGKPRASTGRQDRCRFTSIRCTSRTLRPWCLFIHALRLQSASRPHRRRFAE